MKVREGRKYLDTQRFNITDYMNNFNRESVRPEKSHIHDKNKLTLANLKNYTSKTNKTFFKNTAEDDY